MHPEHEPIHSPRLDRLLRARANRPAPSGLADRLFGASVGMLPASAEPPAVLARVSFRWLAAAAALLLVAGVAIRFSASHATDEAPGASLSVVLDVSDESNLGDEMNHLRALHGARYADLDDEMNQLLADGRVVR